VNISERFDEFINANTYSRIDTQHILELHIGLDEKGRNSIELRSAFTPRKATGTSSIEVNQYRKEAYNTLRFSLCDSEMSGLFYMFCNDLIEQTRSIKDKSQGYQIILNRFFQWKKMFVSSNKDLLTEPEIMGLIGEILFLKGDLADRIGLQEALKSWSGQELTHKDFSYKNKWFEVKAISTGSQSVKISSLDQLDSENEGELVLYSLEKMSEAYNGLTLNKLILDTMKLFDSIEDKDTFMSKFSLLGYKYNSYYDEFVYEIVAVTRYLVNSDFPKLTSKNLPQAIKKAMYEIALSEIKNFKIEG
jgi:hypothetical protein